MNGKGASEFGNVTIRVSAEEERNYQLRLTDEKTGERLT